MNAARDAFLAAMRQVAATVTVVTTDGPDGRMGATVSAFTSSAMTGISCTAEAPVPTTATLLPLKS